MRWTIHTIFFRQFPLQLAYSFNKRKAFNITNSSADFSYNNIIFLSLPKQQHSAFNLIRYMRHHLHSFAQIIAFSFFINNSLINAAGGYIICL